MNSYPEATPPDGYVAPAVIKKEHRSHTLMTNTESFEWIVHLLSDPGEGGLSYGGPFTLPRPDKGEHDD